MDNARKTYLDQDPNKRDGRLFIFLKEELRVTLPDSEPSVLRFQLLQQVSTHSFLCIFCLMRDKTQLCRWPRKAGSQERQGAWRGRGPGEAGSLEGQLWGWGAAELVWDPSSIPRTPIKVDGDKHVTPTSFPNLHSMPRHPSPLSYTHTHTQAQIIF